MHGHLNVTLFSIKESHMGIEEGRIMEPFLLSFVLSLTLILLMWRIR
jgi:hypothetical protein